MRTDGTAIGASARIGGAVAADGRIGGAIADGRIGGAVAARNRRESAAIVAPSNIGAARKLGGPSFGMRHRVAFGAKTPPVGVSTCLSALLANSSIRVATDPAATLRC